MKINQKSVLVLALLIGSLIVPTITYASICFPPAPILIAYGTIPILSFLTFISLLATLPFTLFKNKELSKISRRKKYSLLLILSISAVASLFSQLSLANTLGTYNYQGDRSDNITALSSLAAIVGYFIYTIILNKIVFSENTLSSTRRASTITMIMAPPLVITAIGFVFYLVGTIYAQGNIVPGYVGMQCPGVPSNMWIQEGTKTILGIIITVSLAMWGRKIAKSL